MFVVIINVFHLLSIHNRSIFDEFIHLNIVQYVLHTHTQQCAQEGMNDGGEQSYAAHTHTYCREGEKKTIKHEQVFSSN